MRRCGASRRNASSVAPPAVSTRASAPTSPPTAATSRRDPGSTSGLGANASTPELARLAPRSPSASQTAADGVTVTS